MEGSIAVKDAKSEYLEYFLWMKIDEVQGIKIYE